MRGITEGKIILTSTNDENKKSDTILIKKGEFVFTGDIPDPTMYVLHINGKEQYAYFYAENAKMTFNGHADSLYSAKISGGIVNEDSKRFRDISQKLYKKFRETYKMDSLYKIYKKTKDESIMAKMDEISKKMEAESNNCQLNFIKQNPASYYSAILVSQRISGQSASEMEESLKLLDSKLNNSSIVTEIRKTIKDLKTTDVKVDAFTNNAPDVDYAVDKTFKGSAHKNIIYLAVFF